MARTLNDDDERERRIILIAEYIIETGSSTRQTAEYFTTNEFAISNATVYDYCQRYEKMFPQRKEQLLERMKENKEKTIEDNDTYDRVLKNTFCFLNGNYTVGQLAEYTGDTYWTVYRDLTERIAKINPELAYKVQEKLLINSNNNLDPSNHKR